MHEMRKPLGASNATKCHFCQLSTPPIAETCCVFFIVRHVKKQHSFALLEKNLYICDKITIKPNK